VLQTAPGDLFAQCGGTLLYGLARHEFVSEPAFRFDLNANVVVKAQNAFIFKLRKSHKSSPTLLFRFCLQPDLDQAADGFRTTGHIVFLSPFVDGSNYILRDAARNSRVTPRCRTAAAPFLDFRY
jgi:hypothetical protein